ncbi:MAG: sulfatase [Planctomycetota bacterium]
MPYLRAGWLCGLWVVWLGTCAVADDRPNIVFLLADDQAWDGLSVAMHPDLDSSKSSLCETPVLESLARQGMRFSAAYAPSPVCASTRCSLQTGRSAAANHWTKAGRSVRATAGHKLIPPQSIQSLPEEAVTIGEQLQQVGYATAHFGKWHLRGGGPGKHGYDVHDGDAGNERAGQFRDPNPVDIFGMAERAEQFMADSQSREQPFFIQMSWLALHSPENALEATKRKYGAKARGRAARLAAITEDLDTGVGRVLAAIDNLGLAENTYVIYMSDNGSGQSGALRGGKGSVWEGGIRSPLIVRGPGVAANSWCHVPVVGYDFYPTFCEWAGIDRETLPQSIEGGSLVPVLRDPVAGKVERAREELVFHFPHYQASDGPHTAVRDGDWKLIRFDVSGTTRLFDLSQDIGEQQDLAAEQSDRVERMIATLDRYLAEVDADRAEPNPRYDPHAPEPEQRRPGRRRRRRAAR